MDLDELLYYQLKAEIAIEDGLIEEAAVWATLANSVTTIGPGRRREGLPVEYREMLKDQVRNGEPMDLAPKRLPAQPPVAQQTIEEQLS